MMPEGLKEGQSLAVGKFREAENRTRGLEWSLLCHWLLLNLIWQGKDGNAFEKQ
jgi:hypothetical protein